MNLQALEQKLSAAGIKKYWYSLSGGLPSEAHCLNQTKNGWEVYYSERGLKSNLKFFKKENDACDYFYKHITSSEVIMNDLELE
jgi:hypothetical protein